MHWAWIILAICFLDIFINYSVRLGYGVILPDMIRSLGFSRTDVGSIFNAYLFTYVSLTPLTGYLTDRLGARPVITFCALLLGAGIILMGTVETFGDALLFYGLVGAGATGMWTPVITVAQRWFAAHRRGLALGIVSTGFGLGFAVMGFAYPRFVEAFSWRFAWYFLGSSALVLGIINALLLKSSPESAGLLPWGEQFKEHSAAPAQTGHIRDVLKSRTFWLIGTSYFCAAYSLYGITTFLVDYGQNQLGLPLYSASRLATIHGMSQIFGVLLILPLSDRWGRRTTILISNMCIAGAITGIIWSGDFWPALTLSVALLAVFYGVTFPIYGACAGDYFPRGLMGTVIGFWTPFYGLGAMLSHWAGGILRDNTGIYDFAFGIDAVMAIAALAFMVMVNSKK